jgi:[acyl-carrier-protein] S-malonyltransferase
VRDGSDIVARIVNQIANPVRWDLCMDTLKTMGVTGVIELAPAGTLVGLLKRAAPQIESFALKSATDLDSAREFAERHR